MKKKVREKEKAIEFRKKGYTYKEVFEEVDASESSLSLWLKDLPLIENEKRYLRKRRNHSITRGRIKAATAHRRNREKKEQKWLKKAENEFNNLIKDSFFQVGLALYWGEGAKRSDVCAFMNSDLDMIMTFISWIETYFTRDRAELTYRLYIHKHYEHEQCEKFWAKHIGVPVESIRISFKPSRKQVKKRPHYKGCLRVRIPKSGKLLFKIKVWQNMLARKYI